MKNTLKFYSFALNLVWIGAAIGLSAAVISGFVNSDFSGTTFIFSVLALLASIPVYLKRKKLLEIS